MVLEEHRLPHSKAMVDLLRDGLIEEGHPDWSVLLNHEQEVRRHFAPLGLELVVRRDFNYAFLQQLTAEDGSTLGLMRRRRLGFDVSVLAISLCERWYQFQSQPDSLQQMHCYVERGELQSDFELRMGVKGGIEHSDAVQWEQNFKALLTKLVEHHLLKNTESADRFIVHPFIRERVTYDQLKQFKAQLDELESV